jgi:wyosine [tRNA(Phe)-imidazoG37] synthetase (radical SAM superfamily)
MLTFGPVPSRRLGRSLGINNIPPKVCTFSCVYCQLGRTIKMQVERRAFFEPQKILSAVCDKIEKTRHSGESIDYVTFVPDGEPTLDPNLGREIELLRPLGKGLLNPWLNLAALLQSGVLFLVASLRLHQRSRRLGY